MPSANYPYPGISFQIKRFQAPGIKNPGIRVKFQEPGKKDQKPADKSERTVADILQ
jgi:hypothetical protein